MQEATYDALARLARGQWGHDIEVCEHTPGEIRTLMMLCSDATSRGRRWAAHAPDHVFLGHTAEEALAAMVDAGARCPICHGASARISDASLIQKLDTYECATHGMFEGRKLTRARKVCTKCGHPECPSCGNWCDVVVRVDDDADLCCDGECTYGPGSG